MTRLLSCLTGLGLLGSLTISQVASAQLYRPAAADEPACQGTEIAPDLRGTYHLVGPGESAATIVLAANSITVVTGESATTDKAWSCIKDDALIIVKKSRQNLYRSNLALKGGDFLLVVDEVTKDQSLQPADIQRFLREGRVVYLKREATPPAAEPAPTPPPSEPGTAPTPPAPPSEPVTPPTPPTTEPANPPTPPATEPGNPPSTPTEPAPTPTPPPSEPGTTPPETANPPASGDQPAPSCPTPAANRSVRQN